MSMFLPENFQEGGKIPDGRTVDIVSAEAGTTTYGNTGKTGPSVILKVVDVETNSEYEENLSAGSGERVQPSDDGKNFIDPRSGEPAKLGSGCNLAVFIKSLLEKDEKGAVRQALAANDIHVLAGVRFATRRVAGQKIEEGSKDRTVLTVAKFIQYNTGGAAKAAPKAAGAAPVAAAQASGSGDVADLAAGSIVAILTKESNLDAEGNAKPIMKAALVGALTKLATEDKDLAAKKSQVIALLSNKAFMEGREEFAFDGKAVSLR